MFGMAPKTNPLANLQEKYTSQELEQAKPKNAMCLDTYDKLNDGEKSFDNDLSQAALYDMLHVAMKAEETHLDSSSAPANYIEQSVLSDAQGPDPEVIVTGMKPGEIPIFRPLTRTQGQALVLRTLGHRSWKSTWSTLPDAMKTNDFGKHLPKNGPSASSVHPTGGNGDCFFKAISYQLCRYVSHVSTPS